MARVCRGGGAAICSTEPCAARAPPVGRGPAAVEGVRDAGQADRSISVRPQPHAASSQQGLCRSQVSVSRRKNGIHEGILCFIHIINI